jgi:hypothetical protein
MGKERYVYNEKTLSYEKHTLSPKEKAIRFFGTTAALVVTAVIIALGIYNHFPSPKQKLMENELNQLTYHLSNLEQNFEMLTEGLAQLHEKDNQVHRMIFGIDPLDEAIWEGGIGGHDRYEYLNTYSNTGPQLKSSLSKMDKIQHKFEIQKKSLDSLYTLALQREKRLSSIPSIKPVSTGKLKRSISQLSGFGIRMHPVHKVKKFHQGIDFTAPTGTNIQATGDGTVLKVHKARSGYGNMVEINHGFGYKTLYAHMHTIEVKAGQKVTKGQKIGTVGNTGISTAPHLHYEVHLNGKPVNPIDYVLDGLSPTEYKEIVQRAKIENQSFD